MSCSFVSVPYDAPGGANTPSITSELSELELNAYKYIANTIILKGSPQAQSRQYNDNLSENAVLSRPRGEHNGIDHEHRGNTEPMMKIGKFVLSNKSECRSQHHEQRHQHDPSQTHLC